MKIPWPEDCHDGDVKSFLEDFEDVADVSGLKTDRGKIAALRTRMKSRAKMALGAARRVPAKMEWAAAKEVLLAEFDSPPDRQEAMRQFKTARFGTSENPLVPLVMAPMLSLQKTGGLGSYFMVPHLFVNGIHIGGEEEIQRLHEANQLADVLKKAGKMEIMGADLEK